MADSVLDLTTNTTRPTVKVDHVPYALKTPSDLTLSEFRTIERIGPRIGQLLLADDLPESDNQELEALLDTACRIALDAPSKVHDRLGVIHRVNVVQAFIELLSPSLQRTRARAGVGRSSGANSSRASRASTGETQRRGSRKSRSGPSART